MELNMVDYNLHIYMLSKQGDCMREKPSAGLWNDSLNCDDKKHDVSSCCTDIHSPDCHVRLC